jgi:drug/metabolite transporter (DMT)-like permease
MSKLRTPAGGEAVLAAGFVVLWSSGFIGAKLGTQDGGAYSMLMWRFLIATALLLGWAWLRRGRRPRLSGRQIGVQAGIGLLAQGVYLLGAVKAVELGVATGTAALIAALQPIAAGALAGPVLGERVQPWQWLGLVLGLAGVALVVGGDLGAGHGAAPLAYALPVLGMGGLVAATLLERRIGLHVGVADTLTIHCATSAVLFTALAAATGAAAPPDDPAFWPAVAWTIVLSTFGGYAFYWLNLERGSVTRVSSLLYLTPPTTMVWGMLMFGETVGAAATAGLVVCLAAVAIVRLQPSAARSAAPTSAAASLEICAAPSQRQKPWMAPS